MLAPGAAYAVPIGGGLTVAYKNIDELHDVTWSLERGAPKTYGEIRQWYNDVVGEIPNLNRQWVGNGIDLEQRAKMAFDIRHGARVDARSFMVEPFEVTNLQIRDTVVHGNPNGPTFESLYQKYTNNGLVDNEIFERILSGSNKTNTSYNEKFGIVKR